MNSLWPAQLQWILNELIIMNHLNCCLIVLFHFYVYFGPILTARLIDTDIKYFIFLPSSGKCAHTVLELSFSSPFLFYINLSVASFFNSTTDTQLTNADFNYNKKNQEKGYIRLKTLRLHCPMSQSTGHSQI